MTDDDRDDGVLAPENLARYDVPRAPAGFAARVMAAIGDDKPTAARPRAGAWRRVAIAAGVAAAIAIVAWTVRDPSPQSTAGARSATARETIAIPRRGVVVAEPRTDLRWTVAADGDAVVEQSSGSAFYRVERGGTFEVRTPLGAVVVTGTCFSVEVIAMKKQDMLKGAAIGAALATAVVVTVYEGGVVLANPRGKVQLAPGDVGVVHGDSAPETRGALAALGGPHADELIRARSRIASLETELARARAGSDDDGDEPSRDPGRYFQPSPETLRQMADTCWIAWDQPPFDSERRPILIDDLLADQIGISDAQQDAVNRGYSSVHDRAVDAIRRLFMELAGVDADTAASLSVDSLGEEIIAKSPVGEELAARRRIARERAGLDPQPSSSELARRPVVERYLRLRMSLGHDAEAAAAAVIGADRARKARSHGDVGWRNQVSDYGGCDDEAR